MKKFIGLVWLVLVVLAVTGCGNLQRQSRNFTTNQSAGTSM